MVTKRWSSIIWSCWIKYNRDTVIGLERKGELGGHPPSQVLCFAATLLTAKQPRWSENILMEFWDFLIEIPVKTHEISLS